MATSNEEALRQSCVGIASMPGLPSPNTTKSSLRCGAAVRPANGHHTVEVDSSHVVTISHAVEVTALIQSAVYAPIVAHARVCKV